MSITASPRANMNQSRTIGTESIASSIPQRSANENNKSFNDSMLKWYLQERIYNIMPALPDAITTHTPTPDESTLAVGIRLSYGRLRRSFIDLPAQYTSSDVTTRLEDFALAMQWATVNPDGSFTKLIPKPDDRCPDNLEFILSLCRTGNQRQGRTISRDPTANWHKRYNALPLQFTYTEFIKENSTNSAIMKLWKRTGLILDSHIIGRTKYYKRAYATITLDEYKAITS